MVTKKKTAAKKTAPKKKAASLPAPKAAVKKWAAEVEGAVDIIMSDIDEHEFAKPPTSQESSIDFYRSIALVCTERADTIKQEMDETDEDEGEEDSSDEPLDD